MLLPGKFAPFILPFVPSLLRLRNFQIWTSIHFGRYHVGEFNVYKHHKSLRNNSFASSNQKPINQPKYHYFFSISKMSSPASFSDYNTPPAYSAQPTRSNGAVPFQRIHQNALASAFAENRNHLPKSTSHVQEYTNTDVRYELFVLGDGEKKVEYVEDSRTS
jgi:hypothetical protein